MATPIEQRGYKNPDALVSTDWVEQHLNDRNVRLIESNEDTLLYASGHIPGAKSVPWARAINPDDGTFKTGDELKKLYEQDQKLAPKKETIAYCRIGERSSHTWFALKYLLGFKSVRNYDGSWTEWGNLVGVPIEK